MKILLISAMPPPAGGIATWTEKYKKFCEVHEISLSIVNTALNNRNVERISGKRNLKNGLWRTFYVLHEFKKNLKQYEPDIIHINTSCSRLGVLRDYICALKAHKQKTPIVVHCHCNIQDQIKSKRGKWFLKRMFAIASCIVVLNRESFLFAKKLTKTRIEVIPNFIEPFMVARSHEIKDQIKEIIFVGHVLPAKGCMEIIETAKKYPDTQFYLVGPVAKEITSVFIPENVFLEGRKDFKDIELYLEHADLFLLPSYSEGFSVALLEAMSKGLPCIATDVGANKDMIEDKGGIIIPIKDTPAIVQALKKISQPTVRRAMSEWNIQKVKNEYLIDNVMQKILCLYEEIRK